MTDFAPLFEELTNNAPRWNSVGDWPRDSLRSCGQWGMYRGLAGLPVGDAAQVWSARRQIEVLIQLASADLLTTFVITQHLGAIKRILAAKVTDTSREQILSDLLDGKQMASVGISHLTTSRRHVSRPVVRAEAVADGFRIDGTIPWVTGAPHIHWLVLGATLDDGKELLACVSTAHDGVRPGSGIPMVALSASCTDAIELESVAVTPQAILGGPCQSVLSASRDRSAATAPPKGSGAGGLQTSALAFGLSAAALGYLNREAETRNHLHPIVEQFQLEHEQLRERILAAADGTSDESSADIRMSANQLVQRTTAAAMTTAKGAGMLQGHPVGRWCCQALFFLVWSCPQPVADAHLCELAGLSGDVGS